jgi:hypothetical protein
MISKRTAGGVAGILLKRVRNRRDADEILEALLRIPGNRSYRDSVRLVQAMVREEGLVG